MPSTLPQIWPEEAKHGHCSCQAMNGRYLTLLQLLLPLVALLLQNLKLETAEKSSDLPPYSNYDIHEFVQFEWKFLPVIVNQVTSVILKKYIFFSNGQDLSILPFSLSFFFHSCLLLFLLSPSILPFFTLSFLSSFFPSFCIFFFRWWELMMISLNSHITVFELCKFKHINYVVYILIFFMYCFYPKSICHFPKQ